MLDEGTRGWGGHPSSHTACRGVHGSAGGCGGDGGVLGDAGVLPVCAVLKSQCHGANPALGQVWGRCWPL